MRPFPLLRLAASAIVLLGSCGESPEQETDIIESDSEAAVSQDRDESVAPNIESEIDRTDAFESMIHRQYAYIVAQTTKRETDSVMSEVMMDMRDPRTQRAAIEEAMGRLMRRKESIAIQNISLKYEISEDSVRTILARQNARRVATP